MYWSVDIDEECGASTRPMTWSTPSAAKPGATSSMTGGSYFEPKRTSKLPGARSSRARAMAATWAAVRAASGEVPPISR